MRISLCTTTQNRLAHLQETLPVVCGVLDSVLWLEQVLIVYGDFATWKWLRSEYISNHHVCFTRQLKIYYVHAKEWFCSRAKNIAHIAATGDVLVNVDVDTFTSKKYVYTVESAFKTNPNRLLGCYAFSATDGQMAGRLAIKTSVFREIGGYEEYDIPHRQWFCEDREIMERAARNGYPLDITIGDPSIAHDGRVMAKPTWEEARLVATNWLESRECVKIGNLGRPWASALLTDLHNKTISTGQLTVWDW